MAAAATVPDVQAKPRVRWIRGFPIVERSTDGSSVPRVDFCHIVVFDMMVVNRSIPFLALQLRRPMIRLIDLIRLAGVELGNYKIHLATGCNPTPLEAFFDGKFKRWQEEQNQRNFQCEEIVSLIYLGGERWLFAGVFLVKGVQPRLVGAIQRYLYLTEEVPGLEHLTGRAIVRFQKNFRASYLRGATYGKELLVDELRGQRLSVGDFPGYNGVLLSFQILCTIIREEIPSWRSALRSVSGVYLVVDTANGKQYVGSACGGEGIWQRWMAYVATGHGGNKELKVLLSEKGSECARNFQFSILEVCDLNASQEHVVGRETHWKDVLLSREFGYNCN
jgi:hypothetical protein